MEDARRAPAALGTRLRAGLPGDGSACDGRLNTLLAEAVNHLERVLATRPIESVAAIAVPAAVHRALSDAPVPDRLLASAAATYLAFDALDDQMDGDRSDLWRDRRPSEVIIGAQILLLRAAELVAEGSPPPVAETLRTAFWSMITAVTEGQLGTEQPVSTTTSPAAVAAVIGARSGSMLAGFAELAALEAGAASEAVTAARRFGYELGVARQHVNDLTELVGERTADLRNGTATMAVALALQRLDEHGRSLLLARLRTAAGDADARERLVAEDLAPAIREVTVLIGIHLAQADTATPFLRRTNMSEDGLDRLIEFTAIPARRSHAT